MFSTEARALRVGGGDVVLTLTLALALTLRVGGGDVVRVAGSREASQLAVDSGAPRLGVWSRVE